MNSDSPNTADIVERLNAAAKRSSDIQRQMAEAKSLRQEGHDPPRADLYMWSTPEQTIEGQAAAIITELREALIDWRNCWLCPATDFEAQVGRLMKMTDAALKDHRKAQA